EPSCRVRFCPDRGQAVHPARVVRRGGRNDGARRRKGSQAEVLTLDHLRPRHARLTGPLPEFYVAATPFWPRSNPQAAMHLHDDPATATSGQKVPAAAVWTLGLTQVIGYGTLFYSFT